MKLIHKLIFIGVMLLSAHSYSTDSSLTFAGSDGFPPVSFAENGRLSGLITDIVDFIDNELPGYHIVQQAYPWSRAQKMVQNNHAQIFITYPSDSRKTYAKFTSTPVYYWDYGYLVYNAENPSASEIKSATSFDDLGDTLFIGQHGVSWEAENIPSEIRRELYSTNLSMISILLKRDHGDWLVMSPLQAKYFAKQVNSIKKLAFVKVDFIPNSMIPFQLGVSKSHPAHTELVSEINTILSSRDYQQFIAELFSKYNPQ